MEQANELTVVCWLWGDKYNTDHVYRLRNMVNRHLPTATRFCCISDRILPGIEVIPIWPDFANLPLHYRRLKILSEEAGRVLGPRILQLDLDCVILRDITSLITTERVRIYKAPSVNRCGYVFNTSMLLFDAGALSFIWGLFCKSPDYEIRMARINGWVGSDQAVISNHLSGIKPATWGRKDGIISMRDHILADDVRITNEPKMGAPDKDTKIVMFYGNYSPLWFRHLSWVKQNWV